MAFEKGNKLSNGRPKGSANKSTALVRNNLATLITNEFDSGRVEEALLALAKSGQHKDYLASLAKILPYVAPALAAIKVETNAKEGVTLNIFQGKKSVEPLPDDTIDIDSTQVSTDDEIENKPNDD